MMRRYATEHVVSRNVVLAFVVAGAFIVITGVLSLLAGQQYYVNYWYLPIFAPFAILVGLLAVTVGLILNSRRKLRKH